jgi:hypothetical protein
MLPIRFDIKRLTLGDRIAGGASLALLIGIFLPWFDFGSAETGYFSFSATALRTWMYLVLVITLGLVAYLVVKALRRRRGWPIVHWLILVGACGADLVISLGCFVTKTVGVRWDYGAYLSLVAAVAALAGAVVSQRRPSTRLDSE